nr:altered inheritance of mitochondria protein 9, mitochondrial [Quercus suber]
MVLECDMNCSVLLQLLCNSSYDCFSGFFDHERNRTCITLLPRFHERYAFALFCSHPCRWLDRDTERRNARELHFDFDTLLSIAVKTSKDARRVVACAKKEGGFNRVFAIELDDGTNVVARLPTRLAGPPVRENTKIPVPKILAWDVDSKTSPVGADYMVMDAIHGVSLKDVWGQMTGVQHIQCIDSIGKIAKQICALDFPAFGSLYFNTANKPRGALPFNSKYCIRPHCAPQHWGCSVEKPTLLNAPGGSQGPCLTEIARSTLLQRESSETSVDRHLRLLDTNLSTREALAETEAVRISAKPTLFHPDFDTRNIFVAADDPTQITGIIDWQSAAIEPAFVHAAETPDFAEEVAFDKILDASRDSEMDDMKDDAQRCAQTWAVLTYLCPKLGQAATLDPFLSRYLATPASGWLDDVVSLASLLTDLNTKLADFGLPDDNMYQPSQEDAETLRVKLDELHGTQRLRMYLARLLRCETDGWVATSKWEEVLPVYPSEYKDFVASCVASREESESESAAITKAERLWPFDLR